MKTSQYTISTEDEIKEIKSNFKSLIRKLKIDSSLGNKNILSKLKINLDRNIQPPGFVGTQPNTIAKKLSKYGVFTGSYLYSSLGLIEKTEFKDLDLIVTQKQFDKIKKKFKIEKPGWYTKEIDINSVGFFRYYGWDIDLFINDDVDGNDGNEKFFTHKDINFQLNVVDALQKKYEIFEKKNSSTFDIHVFIKDIVDIIDVLRKKRKPFNLNTDDDNHGSIWDNILNYFKINKIK